ncbi:VanW family protein [Meiothermus granaticius]|uniref:Vancomycin B-type resistance protein VanW n=1 Tax=Meiothermus granaticius NBRC 107808 TaxID=1227551 RepID=A0A399F402_9DEIN|nr:VanW family protein [Meiothermus granaticius]RIH91424.1 Vancomycin B-type resistance protein VanW [Meiothermus granaticius NBRC 107808]GEM87095.1 vancomycin B-type resistance protein vanW [Meiothermus granaticius NBRC 107808]
MKSLGVGLVWLGLVALAGPDAIFYSQQNVMEDGQITTLQTPHRYPIGGIGQIEALISQLSAPAKDAAWSYDKAKQKWVMVDESGYAFALARAKELYRQALSSHQPQFTLPVAYTPAQRDVFYFYQLGIRQLLSEATTRFAGSSNERAYNLIRGASRLNGHIIPPNAVFSFAQAIGEVSLATGYKKAFVISGEQTVEGVGGGMCQVSTTVFRAAYFAGLPIVERRPHSYQVGYYRPAGLDATVFLPQRDLKFKNDTPGSILLQTEVQGTNLTFRFFGTKDRTATWSAPVYLSRTPALPTRYIVSPAMRPQSFQQVDFAAEGAQVRVTRTVQFTDGRKLTDTLESTYRPWGAVWLVGPGTKLRSGRVLTAETDDSKGQAAYTTLTQTH